MLQRPHIVRVLISLLADELKRSRKAAFAVTNDNRSGLFVGTHINEQTSITPSHSSNLSDTSKTSFNADSLELLNLAGRVNQMFHLHEAGVEDYLLKRRTVGDWADIVEAALQQGVQHISFQTSGSTGEPKLCTHTITSLEQEIHELASILNAPTRVLVCVPAHHIYGFLFTAMLPSYLNIPVVEGMEIAPSVLMRLVEDEPNINTILVSFPTYWTYLATSIGKFPAGVTGVTSTAPCPLTLKQTLLSKGIKRLVEVYGSSETGGVGFRNDTDEYLTLFSYWQMHVNSSNEATITRKLPDTTPDTSAMLMDYVEQRDKRHFKPVGRVDGGVQVGGVNVFPQRVAEQFRAIECVADAVVRKMRVEEGERLKAFIILQRGWDATPETERIIRAWITANLSAPEQPKALTITVFGTELPRNAMGKPADWH